MKVTVHKCSNTVSIGILVKSFPDPYFFTEWERKRKRHNLLCWAFSFSPNKWSKPTKPKHSFIVLVVDIDLFAYPATESRQVFGQSMIPSAHQVNTWLFQLCRCFPHSDTAKGLFSFLSLFFPGKKKEKKEGRKVSWKRRGSSGVDSGSSRPSLDHGTLDQLSWHDASLGLVKSCFLQRQVKVTSKCSAHQRKKRKKWFF